MVFKDSQLLEEAYSLMLEARKKTKKPDQDGDGVPDWADKHPGKDDRAAEKKKSFPKMKKEGLAFAALCKSLLEESVTEEDIKDCHSLIKKMGTGKFKGTEKEMEKVRDCKSVFKVTGRKDKYSVLLKDKAVKVLKKVDPELGKKFKTEAACKADIAKCKKEKRN